MSFPEHIATAMSSIMAQYQQQILQEFPEMVTAMSERPFRVSDMDIHPKVLADWNRADLLLVKPERNRMHRFSLTEFVWVKLIQKMRDYNFPLSRILTIKNSLIQSTENEFDEFFNNTEAMNALAEQFGGEQKEQMKAFFSQKELVKKFMQNLPFDLTRINTLDGLILFCLIVKRPISLMIDDNGNVFIFSPIFLERPELDQSELRRLISRSYVSISLTEVLADSMAMAPIESLSDVIRVITDKEKEVLQALNEKELKSVVIRFDKDHQMDLLEVTKEQKVDKQARLLELILMNGYQDITLKTQNGRVLYCENTRKVKLK